MSTGKATLSALSECQAPGGAQTFRGSRSDFGQAAKPDDSTSFRHYGAFGIRDREQQMTATANAAASPATASWAPTKRYRWVVVMTLMVVYALNQLDRQIINILLQPIKLEFALSDLQAGLL